MRRAKPLRPQSKNSVLTAERCLEDLQRQVQFLEAQVNRLTLTTEAPAEILRDRQGIPEQEIELTVREIDLCHGLVVGKWTRPAEECQSCRRPNASRRANCLSCGIEFPPESTLFEAPAAAHPVRKKREPTLLDVEQYFQINLGR